ncbi:MAG: hypothetical protein IPM82_08285 [Saprospiraceae bacterium]|nr:hypothetical protein [Saprospiraceae bacterium]
MQNTFGKLMAVKFIAKAAIEAKILKMQERKAQFAREILATGMRLRFRGTSWRSRSDKPQSSL